MSIFDTAVSRATLKMFFFGERLLLQSTKDHLLIAITCSIDELQLFNCLNGSMLNIMYVRKKQTIENELVEWVEWLEYSFSKVNFL